MFRNTVAGTILWNFSIFCYDFAPSSGTWYLVQKKKKKKKKKLFGKKKKIVKKKKKKMLRKLENTWKITKVHGDRA